MSSVRKIFPRPGSPTINVSLPMAIRSRHSHSTCSGCNVGQPNGGTLNQRLTIGPCVGRVGLGDNFFLERLSVNLDRRRQIDVALLAKLLTTKGIVRIEAVAPRNAIKRCDNDAVAVMVGRSAEELAACEVEANAVRPPMRFLLFRRLAGPSFTPPFAVQLGAVIDDWRRPPIWRCQNSRANHSTDSREVASAECRCPAPMSTQIAAMCICCWYVPTSGILSATSSASP